MKRFIPFWVLFLPLWVLFSPGGALYGQRQRFDPTNFIVVGGALSAGFEDFVLIESSQRDAFPALLAQQMGTIMPLPLLRDGGPVTVISFDPLPDILPPFSQSSLRSLPFPLFTFNLSVPFIRVAESLSARPALPLVRDGETKQSLVNLVLGHPALLFENGPTWSQVEYAEFMAPTFVIVEIGSGDILEAALSGDLTQITPVASFLRDYEALIRRLRDTYATVLIMNVMDPTESAFFSTIQRAAQIYQISPEHLMSRFGLQANDLIALGGLVEIGDHLKGRRSGALSSRAVLRSSTVATIKDAVRAYNSAIDSMAQRQGMRVFDLNGFTREVRTAGVQAGALRLGGGYLEGFYSGDGLFPGALGHAVLANRLLQYINSAYGTRFPLVDLDRVSKENQESASAPPLGSGFEALATMIGSRGGVLRVPARPERIPQPDIRK